MRGEKGTRVKQVGRCPPVFTVFRSLRGATIQQISSKDCDQLRELAIALASRKMPCNRRENGLFLQAYDVFWEQEVAGSNPVTPTESLRFCPECSSPFTDLRIFFLKDESVQLGTSPLYSVLASAKANQVEPFAYVRDLLVQLSGHSPPAAAALLPDAWLTAHPEARRCWSR